MLKISRNIKSTIQLRKGKTKVDSDNKAKCNSRCKFNGIKIGSNEFGNGEVGGNEVENDEVEKNDQKMSKSKKLSNSKKTELRFFISGARMAFIKLRETFVKVLIFHYFDSEHDI